MTAIFIQYGDAIDFAPVTDLPAGSVVVLGHLVGVTSRPLAAGTLGALQVDGVYDFPIAAGPTAGIGEQVFWDPVAGLATLDGTAAGSPIVASRLCRWRPPTRSSASSSTIRAEVCTGG